MEQIATLLWQGPVWYAGRRSPLDAGSIPGLSADVDLLSAFANGRPIPEQLPSAIVIDCPSIAEGDRTGFHNWLDKRIAALKTDVPLILLCASDDILPDILKAHATINRSIADDQLFLEICIHQRALMRVEEARIRRVVFGRIPGYGTAPHYKGTSGLLVIGLGGRFLELQQASDRKVEVIGAFGQGMAETYLSQRAFDAVILDSTLDETLESLRLVRMDARFAALPVLAVAEHRDDTDMLFRSGANDVLTTPLDPANLGKRVATAIRFGKRRRLADKMLAESHSWLMQQLGSGGLGKDDYTNYLNRSEDALRLRGLELFQMNLLLQELAVPEETALMADDLLGTVLSIADATSREEDLVCAVQGLGPVAVLKSELGMERLRKRISSILGHTTL
jgi:DNA-binding response OmpR family regulator